MDQNRQDIDKMQIDGDTLHIYATGLGLTINAYTVVLELSRAERDGSGGGIRDVTIANVNMSPQLAKSLISLLAQMLASYEQQFGEIPVPDEYRNVVIDTGPAREDSEEGASNAK